MQMVKVITPGSQQFNEAVAQIIKSSSRGLVGNDLGNFVKRAGHRFADEMKHLTLKPGDVPVHLIAIGSTEFYGSNRNGDGFKEATCRNYHDTFVKKARFYRNHVNKDPDKSYGYVKYSMYNEPMHRIELLAVLNGTKEAAERNGGYVADEELEKLARGDDIGVSMACTVPFDVCAGCGNKARTRDEYCTGTDEGGHCKRGGVKNRMGMVHDDGFVNHVDNPNPCFFDISRVWRPADRIAYVLGKAASSQPMGGAAIAEEMGLTLPLSLITEYVPEYTARQIKLAYALSALEHDVITRDSPYDLAFNDAVQPTGGWASHKGFFKEALAALAREKVSMPLEGFLQFVLGDKASTDNVKAKVASYLPGVYTRLLHSPDFDKKIMMNAFVPAGECPTLELRLWAKKQAEAYTLDRESVQKRVWLASMRGAEKPINGTVVRVKEASDESPAAQLANQYALYKLAFLQAVESIDRDFSLTCELVVRQNYS